MLIAMLLIGETMGLIASTSGEDAVSQEIPVPDTKALFDFEDPDAGWRIIDDGVMGGRSKGSWRVAEGIGLFAGALSLENNGGFSSVRSQPVAGTCDGAVALKIRVRGDGRRYQFRIRTSAAFDGPSYRLSFETKKDTWQEITLPLEKFEPSFRGRVLEGQPPLLGKDIVTVGFLLADKKAGPFRLEVDWIAMTLPKV